MTLNEATRTAALLRLEEARADLAAAEAGGDVPTIARAKFAVDLIGTVLAGLDKLDALAKPEPPARSGVLHLVPKPKAPR